MYIFCFEIRKTFGAQNGFFQFNLSAYTIGPDAFDTDSDPKKLYSHFHTATVSHIIT